MQAKRRYSIVVTDLDGTLLRSDRTFSRVDLDTLAKLDACGVYRVIATGRSVFSAHKVLDPAFPIDYLIFSSGTGVVDWQSGEILMNNQFSCSQARMLVEQLLQDQLDFMVHQPVPDNHYFHYSRGNEDNADFEHRLSIYQDYAVPLNDLDQIRESSQIVIIEPTGTEVHEKLRRDLAGRATVIRATSPLDGESMWVELFPPMVSKGHSFRWLCQHLAVSLADSIGIGNDYNDLDLLEITASSFVVENAPEELKRLFPVTSHHDRNGFSDAVRSCLDLN